MPLKSPQLLGKRAPKKHWEVTGEHSSKKPRVESIPATKDEYSDTDHSDTDDEFTYLHLLGEDSKFKKKQRRRNSYTTTKLRPDKYIARLYSIVSDNADREYIQQQYSRAGGKGNLGRKRELKYNASGSAEGAKPQSQTRPPKPKQFRQDFDSPSNSSVSERGRVAVAPTGDEQQDMDELNARLRGRESPAEAMQDLHNDSKFLVAEYRGVHYGLSNFDADVRRKHRGIDERDYPILSRAALEEGFGTLSEYVRLHPDWGSEASEDFKDHQKRAMKYGSDIREALHELKGQEAPSDMRNAVPRNTDKFVPKNQRDLLAHFYSQDYKRFFASLKDARSRSSNNREGTQPLDSLFMGLPNDSNPLVSTGDIPVHANKYAHGIKSYKGNEKDVLEPAYDNEGRPRHPYSGKLYISLHEPGDLESTTQLLQLQNENRTNIAPVILPESETQFDGYMEGGRVVEQRIAKFPKFTTEYKNVFAMKYGIRKPLYHAFQRAFMKTKPGSVERLEVEAHLTSYLTHHADLAAVEIAQELAAERGARLVYRSGDSFTFNPPKVYQGAATWPDVPK